MASTIQDDETEITGINVTPLVDIVLVLLIIFMVTANFIVRESVEAELPRAAHAGETVQGLVNVLINKEGKLFWDGTEVTEAELVRRIEAVMRDNNDARAVVSADQSLNYGRVMRILDLIKGQGLAKVALAVQKDTTPSPMEN